MKSIIFSDAHIHPHKGKVERLNDCLKVLEWVFNTAEERDIKTILFCGDLFHDKQKIDVLTYQKTFEVFVKKMPGKKFYLLLGNHDMYSREKWDISSAAPLAAIPGVTVVDRPCSLDIDGYEVGFLPYTHNPPEDLKKIKIESDFKVLLAHVAVDGALWNLVHSTIADVAIEHDGEMVKVTPDVFDDYDQVFLGHYHAEQKLTKSVEYVGSPLQLNFGETEQQKHIIEYDFETHKKKYIKNNFSPVHLVLTEKDDILSFDLENNFIRIVSEDISSSELIGLKNEVLQKNLGSLEIKQKPKKTEDDLKMVEDAKSILSTGDQMLQKFIESLTEEQFEKYFGKEKVDKKKLLEFGKQCIEV
ncbi:MAG: hypothetical protein DWQ19_11520 [Crenarchaeota archaeon]|nr:MAG: hypothetical protein DWQ19_11520 [Thermoproteota archaeon]